MSDYGFTYSHLETIEDNNPFIVKDYTAYTKIEDYLKTRPDTGKYINQPEIVLWPKEIYLFRKCTDEERRSHLYSYNNNIEKTKSLVIVRDKEKFKEYISRLKPLKQPLRQKAIHKK